MVIMDSCRFGEGVVISCFCVHFSPIAYSLRYSVPYKTLILGLLATDLFDMRFDIPLVLRSLFVSSHGGTMTMSLMHQWHDTICGGVISPRRCLFAWMHPRTGCYNYGIRAARLRPVEPRGKDVITARAKAVVNAVKRNNVNAVKASACWVWKPKTKVLDLGNSQMDLQDQGVIDNGCSRHMKGNMSYLTDYEAIDGRYVAFGGNPKGRKITGKV
ncbi:hypothetical protein Tco_1219618 [Tanacetum coccineum]